MLKYLWVTISGNCYTGLTVLSTLKQNHCIIIIVINNDNNKLMFNMSVANTVIVFGLGISDSSSRPYTKITCVFSQTYWTFVCCCYTT